VSIPRLIHFVWIGPPMPAWAADNVRLFRELNPDFLCQVHGEEALLPFLAPAYQRIRGEHLYSRRSDLLRIGVLLQHGGWYLDCDFLPIRPLADVYRDQGDFPRDCFVTQCDWVAERHEPNPGGPGRCAARRLIANGVIGTTADSPFLAAALRGILMADLHGHEAWDAYGPRLFTEIVERYPGIAHVDVMDNWYRLQPRERSMAAYRAIRKEGFSREAIRREIGDALPYALHQGMQDETELPGE